MHRHAHVARARYDILPRRTRSAGMFFHPQDERGGIGKRFAQEGRKRVIPCGGEFKTGGAIGEQDFTLRARQK